MKTNAIFATAALSFAMVSGAAFAQSADAQPAAKQPASAQSAKVAVGMTVYGPEGGVVGKIDSVANGVATVNTGAHVAALPLDRFGSSERGPTITVSKAELDAIVAKADAEAAAKLDAALIAGAPVVDVNGVPVGTIGKVDETGAVVLETTDGPVAFKKEHFMVGQTGALTARVTADQIKATLAASQA